MNKKDEKKKKRRKRNIFFFQAEDGIRDFCLSRGLGDVYKRQRWTTRVSNPVRYPRSRASASVSAW